jgi:hypothetical protein
MTLTVVFTQNAPTRTPDPTQNPPISTQRLRRPAHRQQMDADPETNELICDELG